ncbi:MAG: MurR/RpiR family transcriptional regulator [Thermodesulfobacteriota bacterium]
MAQQNILQIIEARKTQIAPKHLKIARYLLSHYEKVAFLSSTQLAKQVGVSQPTVIRFSQALGFAKYQNFSEAFQELIKAELTSADRFNLSLEDDQTISDGASNIILREIKTLTRLNQSFPWESFDKALTQIVQAGGVHIVGTRGSASLAQYFGYFLSKVKRHVHVITHGATEQYDKIRNLNKTDLVVAIAFPRYPRETVELVAHCKKRNLKILAITDQPESPLMPMADYSIIIPITFSTIFDSYCSALCLFNMLITQTGKKNKRESSKLFDEFEQMAREREFFTSRMRRGDD